MVSTDLTYRRRPDLETKQLPCLWLEIGRNNNNSFLLANIYRAWSHPEQKDSRTTVNQLERLRHFLDKFETALNSNKEIILCGDLNLDANKWINPHLRTWSLKTIFEEFQQRVLSRGLDQMVEINTRTGFRGPSRLDLVLTNKRTKLMKVRTWIQGDNDHSLLEISRVLKVDSFAKRSIYTRAWSKINYEQLSEELDTEKLDRIHVIDDVNEAVNLLTEEVQRVLDSQQKMKTVVLKPNFCPWMTPELRKQINKKNRLHRKYRKTPTVQGYREWRKLRNFTSRETSRRIKEHNEGVVQAAEEDSNKLWKFARQQLGWTTAGSPTSLLLDDKVTVTTDTQEMSDLMNEFFVNKIDKILDSIPKHDVDPIEFTDRWLVGKDVGELSFDPVTEETVINIIKRLRNSGAFGEDCISTTCLKKLKDYLTPYLTSICNISFRTKKYPDRWKIAHVSPLFKSKGSALDRTNYRPVAVVDSFSKVLEKAVNDKLTDYLEQRHLLTDRQHGYRRNRSTTTAIIQLLDKVVQDGIKNKNSLMIACDCSAAFDTISHQTLVRKLSRYGVVEDAVEWFTDYLANRWQRVVIGGGKSILRKIRQGVFQGSILGPLLFILYMNDIAIIESLLVFVILILFADDTSLKVALTNDPELDQRNVDRLLKLIKLHFDINHVKNNESKMAMMTLSTKEKFPDALVTVTIDDKPIVQSRVEKFLGIWLPRNLRFDHHITNHVLAPLTSRISGLRKLKGILNKKSMKILGSGIVTSKIIFGIQVWSNCLAEYQGRLQVLMNEAVREINNVKLKDHVRIDPLLNQMGWLRFSNLKKYMDVLLARSIINSRTPMDLADRLSTVPRHDRTLRSVTNQEIQGRLELGKLNIITTFFTYRCVKAYNSIPPNIRAIRNEKQFKIKLKKYLQRGIKLRGDAEGDETD